MSGLYFTPSKKIFICGILPEKCGGAMSRNANGTMTMFVTGSPV